MRLYSVQLLRAVAALVVLFGHVAATAAAMGAYHKAPMPTGSGVDLFFAISGFIMVFASDRLFGQPGAGKTFLLRRLARVLPLYWLSTTTMLALLAIGSKGIAGLPSWSYVLSSYLFVPDRSFGSVGGVAFPVLSLGWTLNYEMLFYLVFSAFIALPRRQATIGVLTALLALVLAGMATQPSSDILATWTQPIILEFGLGLIIGNALLDGRCLPSWLALLMMAAALAWLLADPFALTTLRQTPNDWRRLCGWGLPMAAILAAAVLGPRELPAWSRPAAALLGDASYSLYLTHPFILVAIETVWLHTIGPRHLVAFIITVIVVALCAAVGVNKLIERPFTRALQRFRAPTKAPARAASA